MQEGYIKFRCEWERARLFAPVGFDEVNLVRTRLWDLGLVGVKEDGIGFGNLSIRLGDLFLITGSQTGDKRILSVDDYSLVLDYSWEGNWLRCRGEVKASSESLSHSACYRLYRDVRAVIHVHSLRDWQRWLDRLPTTDRRAEYGSPELAREIASMVGRIGRRGILIMGGHEEGILSWGESPTEALNLLLEWLDVG